LVVLVLKELPLQQAPLPVLVLQELQPVVPQEPRPVQPPLHKP
jgi:hypothetical protein